MGHVWSGNDVGSSETLRLNTVVSIPTFAPSVNPYTLTRFDFTVSVRAHITASAGIPENWWVSSEMLVDLAFATDGVDVLPDISSSDERVLYVTKLVPHLAYAPTASHYSIVWTRSGTEIQSKGQRKSTVLGALAPAVFTHVTAFDQHGVFANSGFATNRLFAVDFVSRALWKADF